MLNVIRYAPHRDLARMQHRLNHLLGDAVTPFVPAEGVGSWLPPVDITEETDRLVFRVEIPGVDKDDIDVKVENGTLILRGEKKQPQETQGETTHRVERYYGAFSRSFVLPTTVNVDAIQARYKDGILELVLPKADEAKPRRIQIVQS